MAGGWDSSTTRVYAKYPSRGGGSVVVSTGGGNIVGVPAWSDDDTIVFATREGIWSVSLLGSCSGSVRGSRF